jgi:hypothetical protein
MCCVYGIAPQALLSGSREFDRNKQSHKTVERKQAEKKAKNRIPIPKCRRSQRHRFGLRECKSANLV